MRAEQDTLDDPAALRTADPGGMLSLAGHLGGQLRDGYRTARDVEGLPPGKGVRAVVVCGMGGSGVAGDLVRALLADRLAVPVVVVKGYLLPRFCGPDTLVVASSFSGNTEETLAAYAQAMARGCRVVSVSAGGKLAALSAADDVAHVPVPPEVPMPRAALGYLCAAPLAVLEAMELIPAVEDEVRHTVHALQELAGKLGPDRPTDGNEAKALAWWLLGRIPVVWGSEGPAEAAALRWKTQLNENAKVPAFHSVIPELDHNEIEGWSPGSGGSFALVVLRHPGEHPRVGPRLDGTLEAIAPAGLAVRQVHSRGSVPLAWLLSLIMWGDFVTTYLAVLRGVDPLPIPTLTRLKERLAE